MEDAVQLLEQFTTWVSSLAQENLAIALVAVLGFAALGGPLLESSSNCSGRCYLGWYSPAPSPYAGIQAYLTAAGAGSLACGDRATKHYFFMPAASSAHFLYFSISDRDSAYIVILCAWIEPSA